jgi:hypothetical protein
MHVIDARLFDIDPDDAFLLSYPRRPERYEDAAEQFPGLPLLIVDKGKRVICGHDYLLLLRQRGAEDCMVLQVDQPPEESLLLNYHVLERLFGLNLYEKLLFVKKIAARLSDAEIQRRADLGFPLNEPLRQRLDLLLCEPLRACLAAGKLGLRTAMKLAEQEKTDREAQLGVFHSCGFSESQQWQLALMLEEIAFRDKKPIAGVLAASGLLPLLEGEMPQKKFMDALRDLRYPACALMEKEWRSWRKKTAPGGGLTLSHAPFFASEEIQVTFSVKNRIEAEKWLRRLQKSLAH